MAEAQTKNDVFLTIHGHFYQPPRENPWLEAIEFQESALPFHDWNERINKECYNPNSFSKIVDNRNRILDVVNNYEYMSFNFGPTLLSWMDKHAPHTYERIIKADIESRAEHNGHGNAMAQVYNHIIMPLANEHDKETQIKWGIYDFEYRFGRKPEGIWLAETAVDDETLRLCEENGIKFVVLSPYQALKIREENYKDWQDVSWGNIDPARSYRYNIKSAEGKFIDLFFYDGAISRSVAFDELLKDGNKFIKRLKEGVSNLRNYPQLVNIATDGESYGHHTKFGDMALAYVVKIKAEEEGFKITNYAEYLSKYRSNWEVDIKQASSWSCFHGVGRWKEDCGCSTGGHPGWNQKWRKPLRDALDYLRDEFVEIFETEGAKYFDNVWDVRNAYIEVILDRSRVTLNKFQNEFFHAGLSDEDKVRAMELLEIQRQCMLMYTSCGWFFSEISGIETVQIMKYAARAMQLAGKFSSKNFEERFLEILSEAKSNIQEFGTGRDIFERFVKPSIVSLKQIAALWAISSICRDFEDEENLYCYTITKKDYKKSTKDNSTFVTGNISITSNITQQKTDYMFALVHYSGGDFHCAIKRYSEDFPQLKQKLEEIFETTSITEIIRALDENFGKEYFTLKDIFIEERRHILEQLLKEKMEHFSQMYQDIYNQGKSSIYQMKKLGVEIPEEFKIATKYALSKKFNDLVIKADGFMEPEIVKTAQEIDLEAKELGIKLYKEQANKIFAKKIEQNISKLAYSMEIQQAELILEIFDCIEKMGLNIDIAEAQNTYFTRIYHRISEIIEVSKKSKRASEKRFAKMLVEIGQKLNINTEFYGNKI